MPETIIKRAITPPTGRSLARRKNVEGKRRKECDRTGQKAPAIVADSIFGLKVIAKPGIAVAVKMQKKSRYNFDEDNDDYGKMYTDLLACLHNAIKITGGDSTFDPLKSGLDLSVSIYYVMNCFKNEVVPVGYQMNIDRDDEIGYHFTIYKDCPFEGYWHDFEVKPIVRKLKSNPALHDIFISVLKCMMSKAGIGAWWNGGMGYAEYMLEEEIENWDVNHPDHENDRDSMKAFQKAVKDKLNYEGGEAKEYQNLIESCPYNSPDALLERLQKFSSKNRIVIWLKKVCEFLKLKCCIEDFIYEEDLEGLKFDQQVSIIWDRGDHYTYIQGECLDSEANGIGINEPFIFWYFTPKTDSFDLQKLEADALWPSKLTSIYQDMNDLLQSFKRKKK